MNCFSSCSSDAPYCASITNTTNNMPVATRSHTTETETETPETSAQQFIASAYGVPGADVDGILDRRRRLDEAVAVIAHHSNRANEAHVMLTTLLTTLPEDSKGERHMKQVFMRRVADLCDMIDEHAVLLRSTPFVHTWLQALYMQLGHNQFIFWDPAWLADFPSRDLHYATNLLHECLESVRRARLALAPVLTNKQTL